MCPSIVLFDNKPGHGRCGPVSFLASFLLTQKRSDLVLRLKNFKLDLLIYPKE